jgi:hypothetical protein
MFVYNGLMMFEVETSCQVINDLKRVCRVIVNTDMQYYESVRLFVSTAVCCCLVTEMKYTELLLQIIII